jgi:peptidoglycan/xylan/chitin deacetylase (PgdA/CDA1 family)
MTIGIFTVIGSLIGFIALVGILWVIYCVVQEFRKDRVPALLYHHFAPGERVDGEVNAKYHPVYFCYEAAFDEQMKYLCSEGYTSISLNEFVAFQKQRAALPSKPIIITFDDGFMSNYLYAFPILKKYGMTATIFMTVDVEAENFKKYQAVDAPLTKAQLKEMSESGICIESHSMTHPYLSSLSTEAVRWELLESRRFLESLLQKPIKFIAIPSGAYDHRVKSLVRETGYEAAFCMLKGTNHRRSDPYSLRRLVIGRDFTINDFREILHPKGGLFLRLTSSIQNVLLLVLGPKKLDMFRDFVYRLPLGTSLIRGQLKYVVPGIAAVTLILLISIILALRDRF